MGSGQSTRKLTIDNEEESLIELSESVAERITQQMNKANAVDVNEQQKEQELHNQNNYWQKRLENLEQKHSRINDIIDAEYKKAAEQLYSNAKKTVNIQDTIQPCQSSSGKVLKCYQDHPKEILKCSTLVEEFSNCVDQRRARVIAARC
ncbi:unnamed protein product [Xylocopa violacea]|uniref:MICOS complex subunit MIC19 n=1 Tax=Xylocopa violacea TaxID=135666 RepID=A0ABP1N8P3_XYLVO